MANYWADKGWNVSIITLDAKDKPPFFPLQPTVTYLPLEIWSSSFSFLRTLVSLPRVTYKLSKAINDLNSDIIISCTSRLNCVALVATFFSPAPLIAMQPTSLEHLNSALSRFFVLLSYLFCSRIIFQSQSVLNSFPSYLHEKGVIIPNPVLLAPSQQKRDRKTELSKRILAMGRLQSVKGFDLLIRAFAIIVPKHPNCELVIYGEGPMRKQLESLVLTLGLSENVSLPGLTSNPTAKFQNADIFVLSSRYEGFPNVLCEAMACGLPVIGSNCPGAVSDIIQNRENGILVAPEDTSALEQAMLELSSDDVLCQKLSKAALKVQEDYSLDKIVNRWEDLLASVTED